MTGIDSLSLYEFAFIVKKINKKLFNNSIIIDIQNKSKNMIPYSYITNKRLKKLLPLSINYEIDNIVLEILKYYQD